MRAKKPANVARGWILQVVESKKTWVCIAIIVLNFSMQLKLENRFHGRLFFLTPDTEHVLQAATWLSNMGPESKPSLADTYERGRFSKEPKKYPLVSTLLYFHASRLLGQQFDFPVQFPLFLSWVRIIHVMAFSIGALILFALPGISLKMKSLCVVMACLSMVLHQYGGDVRVHVLAGVLLFLSVILAMRIFYSKHPLPWMIAASAMAGMATGALYTAAIALVPILLGVMVTGLRMRYGWPRLLALSVVVLTTWAMVFGYFHPALFSYMAGSGPLFNSMHFREQNFAGMFGWGGMAGYLNDMFGVDPLIYAGYIAGLVYLVKSGHWRQPVWLCLLFTALPYQISMAMFYDYTVRRASFVFLCILPIATFGWMEWRRRHPRWVMPLLAALVLLSVANIFKYNALTRSDTRELAHLWVREHIPRGSRLMTDSLNPIFEYSPAVEHDEIIECTTIVQFHEYLEEHFYELFPEETQNSHKMDLAATVRMPRNLPMFMRACHIDYYALNSAFRLYEKASDVGEVLAQSELLERFEPFPGAKPEDCIAWPPDGNSYFIWKMWRMDHAGPIVEIYRLKPARSGG